MSDNPNSGALSLARSFLGPYATALYPPFRLPAHLRIVISKLEAVERGEIKRLMIFMPPRHGKSLTATQLFPAWFLGRNPSKYVISASYGQDLADGFGRSVRNFLSEPLHQAIFPSCRLSGDSASMRRFSTTAGASYYAVGRGGPITGRGAHLLLIDDPLKDREEARSENIRRQLHDWYRNVIYTRLQPNAAIVIICTRWHEDDLAGRLLREHASEKWNVINLPA